MWCGAVKENEWVLILGTGHWVLGTGYWVLVVAGSGAGGWVLMGGCRVGVGWVGGWWWRRAHRDSVQSDAGMRRAGPRVPTIRKGSQHKGGEAGGHEEETEECSAAVQVHQEITKRRKDKKANG